MARMIARLLGISSTSKGDAPELLKGLAFDLALPAPMLVDRTLCLGTALLHKLIACASQGE